VAWRQDLATCETVPSHPEETLASFAPMARDIRARLEAEADDVYAAFDCWCRPGHPCPACVCR